MTTTAEQKKKKNAAGNRGNDLSGRLEELKHKLDEASGHAKKNIRSTIEACTEQYNRAIEANKQYIGELRDQMKDSQIDTSTLDEISSTFVSSLQMSDEVIDAIIDSHLRRVSQIVDFNKKAVESLNQAYATDKFDYEKFFILMQKNFEQSTELSTHDMKKIVEVYNKHINLSLNFSKRFSKNINSQVDVLSKMQGKGLQAYSDWISAWWKE